MNVQIANSLLAQALEEELRRVREASRQATMEIGDAEAGVLPATKDYSPYVRYIRHQGTPGWGCFAYSTVACWDIQNAIVCPGSPNISANRLLWFHVMRAARIAGGTMIKEFVLSGKPAAAAAVGGWFAKRVDFYTPDGRPCKSEDDYLKSFGAPTEGTEWTDPDGVRWPTSEGDYEASNFRLKERTPVPVNLDSFRAALTRGPMRIEIPQHFVALVGYDDTRQRFKYLDSGGDRSGEAGFRYIAYSEFAKEVRGGESYEFVAPRSVPTATITLHHSFRQDVYVWLRVEGCSYAKRIWPNNHRQDDSRNLTLTIMLPRGFVWPPGPSNRIFLDVYDSGDHTSGGGDVNIEASFCRQRYVRDRPAPVSPGYMTAGVTFPTRQMLTLHVP